jgi:hypothetical protein
VAKRVTPKQVEFRDKAVARGYTIQGKSSDDLFEVVRDGFRYAMSWMFVEFAYFDVDQQLDDIDRLFDEAAGNEGTP